MQGNALYVVQGHDHPWLLSSRLSAQSAHWIAGTAPESKVGAKTRYRQVDAASWVERNPCAGEGASDQFALNFETPQWAVTPGQSAVLYRGEVCLGGGIIYA